MSRMLESHHIDVKQSHGIFVIVVHCTKYSFPFLNQTRRVGSMVAFNRCQSKFYVDFRLFASAHLPSPHLAFPFPYFDPRLPHECCRVQWKIISGKLWKKFAVRTLKNEKFLSTAFVRLPTLRNRSMCWILVRCWQSTHRTPAIHKMKKMRFNGILL